MAKKAISDPTVRVNNNGIYVIPNSVKFDEGEGETDVRATSGGAGDIEIVTSDNVEQKIGMCSFDLPNTIDAIELARGWKKNKGVNVIEISGSADGQNFSRVISQASVTNNYEVNLSAEGVLSLEWKGTQTQ